MNTNYATLIFNQDIIEFTQFSHLREIENIGQCVTSTHNAHIAGFNPSKLTDVDLRALLGLVQFAYHATPCAQDRSNHFNWALEGYLVMKGCNILLSILNKEWNSRFNIAWAKTDRFCIALPNS